MRFPRWAGRKTEDGPTNGRYALPEMPHADYIHLPEGKRWLQKLLRMAEGNEKDVRLQPVAGSGTSRKQVGRLPRAHLGSGCSALAV